jgi:hypothetical protein
MPSPRISSAPPWTLRCWVLSVARRGGTSLADALARAAGDTQSGTTVTLGALAPVSADGLDEDAFERALLELAGEAGDFAKRFAGSAYVENVDALRGDLVKFLRPLGRAAVAAEVSLDGEVGSLVSALKKKRRDTDGFFGYHDAVLEELGDVLWYASMPAEEASRRHKIAGRLNGSFRLSSTMAFTSMSDSRVCFGWKSMSAK